MGEVVNLRIARKRAKRRHSAERAAENRLSHGVSPFERKLEDARSEKSQREHDQHRIETGDAQ
jgi:Domain of unknown function (DUF4169)